MISIITPTYNRAYILKNAYESLKKQTNTNFEWIIIDDGSNDNTENLVKKFSGNNFNVKYIKKLNGGKHTAVNLGVKNSSGELILILDSDDTLTPNAVDLIEKKWKKYSNESKICGMCFLKKYVNNTVVSKPFSGNEFISNSIDFKYNKNIKGDMCEIYRRDILIKYPFPVFNSERFLSEALVWNKISFFYDTVYFNIPIYICEYLNDGLTNSSLKLRYLNPIGAKENAKQFMNKRFKLWIRIKNSILYSGFASIAKLNIKEIINNSNNKTLTILFLPLGMVFKCYVLIKCRKEKKQNEKK